MNRLKQKEIADFRIGQLLVQGGKCPLCTQKIAVEDAVLDHDHTTGKVRGVLHRACNSAEGRVMKWAHTSKHYDPIDFIIRVAQYVTEDYSEMPYHPKHLTPNEKEIKKLTKLMRAKKKQETKNRYQVKIDALYEMIRRENGYK